MSLSALGCSRSFARYPYRTVVDSTARPDTTPFRDGQHAGENFNTPWLKHWKEWHACCKMVEASWSFLTT